MSPPPSRMAAAGRRAQLVSRWRRASARATIASIASSHSFPALRTQSSSSAECIDSSSCMMPLREHELGVRQLRRERLVLVDRHVVLVARVDLQRGRCGRVSSPSSRMRSTITSAYWPLRLWRTSVSAADLAPHRLGMGAAHRIDQRRLALERHDDVAGERVPLPMAGQPQHAAAEAPVAGAARHDRDVELDVAHLGAQRGIAAGVFLLGELLVHRVAVVGRVAHEVERLAFVEPQARFVPGQEFRLGRRGGHGRGLSCDAIVFER